ncbi:MAG: iron chelate uptake ABC transporter family permease subunit, partial [Devosiaceae bacterium]
MRLNLLLFCILAALGVLSLANGTTAFSADQMIAAFTGSDHRLALIVYEIRLPRTLLALLIGGSLGLAG